MPKVAILCMLLRLMLIACDYFFIAAQKKSGAKNAFLFAVVTFRQKRLLAQPDTVI